MPDEQEQDDNSSHPCPEGGHVLDAFFAKVGFRLLVGVNMFCGLVAVFFLQPGLGGEMFWRSVRMERPRSLLFSKESVIGGSTGVARGRPSPSWMGRSSGSGAVGEERA